MNYENKIFEDGKCIDSAIITKEKAIEIQDTLSRKSNNFHILLIKHIGEGLNTPAKVKIISERFNQSVSFSFWDNQFEGDYTRDKAQSWLKLNGFNVIGTGEGKGHYYLITDTFKPLKGE